MDIKIESDKARFELLSYQLDDLDLINCYNELRQLRESIQTKYFSILKRLM